MSYVGFFAALVIAGLAGYALRNALRWTFWRGLGAALAALVLFASVATTQDDKTKAAAQAAAAANREATARAAAAHRAQVTRQIHERRVAWQESHPAEYARRRAEQRAAALLLERKHIAVERARIAARRAQEVAAEQQRRASYHAYWDSVVGLLALAQTSLLYARQADDNGDAVTAYRFLQEGQKAAFLAFDKATDNVPDGWNDISNNLQLCAVKLKESFVDGNRYLNSRAPGDGAKAVEESDDARQYLSDATSAARQAYVSMGGQATDIEDPSTVAQNLKSTLDSNSQ